MADKPGSPSTYLVDRQPEQITPEGVQADSSKGTARTTAKHGVTGPECKRWINAIRWMENHRQRRSRLSWASIARADRGSIYDAIGRFRSAVTKLQGEHGLPKYSALVIETSGGVHGHLAYLSNDAIDERLKVRSFGADIHTQPVKDSDGIALAYNVKERTPQANYKRQHVFRGGRLAGSHQLPGGGDRVRLSKELERDASAADRIEPWQKTNAKRTPATARKDYRPRPIVKRAAKLSGQIPLLPEIERPVSRLRDYGGGSMPKAVAKECEHHRTRFGLSQDQLARLIGVSQPTYANVIGNRFGLSSFAARRLREVLLMRSAG